MTTSLRESSPLSIVRRDRGSVLVIVMISLLFATLALFRAPYMVVLGVLPQVTHTVTGLVVAGEVGTLRSLARRLVVLGSVTVAVAALLGWAIGPEVVRAVFGDTVEVGAGPAALVATGCALALVNVVMMVGALVQDRPARVAGAWVVALLVGATALLALGSAAPLDRVVVAFLVAEVTATVALAVVASAVLRPGRTSARGAGA